MSSKKFRVFIATLIGVKVLLAGLFASGYDNDLFIPFADTFISSLFSGDFINPYDFYYELDRTDMFPYPPVMLAIVVVGRLLSYPFAGSLFLSNLMFKIPILLFDCLGLYWLCKLFPQERKYVAVFYFACPIVLYAAYMHGQLDLIPTVFLLGSLFYLTNRRPRRVIASGLLLGLALSAKMNILAAIPLIFFFLLRQERLRSALAQALLAFVVLAIAVAPFAGNGIMQCVFLNSEQGAITSLAVNYPNVSAYIVVLAAMVLYLKIFTLRSINRDLLYASVGLIFALLLLLTSPMPGWYVWVVPYVSILFITTKTTDKYPNMVVYAALNLAYCAYFFFFHHTSYVGMYLLDCDLSFLKVNNPIIQNIVFSVLCGLLAYTAYMIYRNGVAGNSYYRRNTTFTIGITGDSGSGKSSMVNLIERALGRGQLLFIEGDGDHRWARDDENWASFTHLNPRANYIYRQAKDLALLRQGQHVKRVDYDHDTGQFTEAKRIIPKPFTILCGLHALYLPQTRSNLDLKIYMDTEETLRRYWKVQRDIGSRGYSQDAIAQQIDARMKDAEKYIYPQKQHADLVVSYFDPSLSDCFSNSHKLSLCVNMTMDSSIDLERLVDIIEESGISISFDYSDDLEKQRITLTGRRLMDCDLSFDQIASELVPRIEEIAAAKIDADNNLNGILEIVVLMLIAEKMRVSDGV